MAFLGEREKECFCLHHDRSDRRCSTAGLLLVSRKNPRGNVWGAALRARYRMSLRNRRGRHIPIHQMAWAG